MSQSVINLLVILGIFCGLGMANSAQDNFSEVFQADSKAGSPWPLGLDLKVTLVSVAIVFLFASWNMSSKTPKTKKEYEIPTPKDPENPTPYQHKSKTIVPDEVEDDFKADIVIIGGGVAGSALAKVLAEDGRKIVMLERDLAEPDRIVGELLQPGGVHALEELNLESCIEQIDGQRNSGYVVFHPEEDPKILNYPPSAKGKKETGIAFHHGRFIQNLREAARKQPNLKIVEGTASTVLKEGERVNGVMYKTKTGETKKIFANLTVAVDGCFSNFRKQLLEDTNKPSSTSKFYGLILKTHLPYYGYGHVFLVEPSIVLCYTIGYKETRILVDIPNDRLGSDKSVEDFLLQVTLPQLPQCLQEPLREAVKEGNVRSMPCTTLHPSSLKYAGTLVLGDAWNMRHPLTGGGMTVCLSDVTIIRKLLKDVDLQKEDQVDQALKAFYKRRKPLACTINTLAFSLYSVLKGSEAMKDMQDGCIKYFELGGSAVAGPMSLLGGLETSPLVLIAHYTCVALYAVLHVLRPFPTPRSLFRASNMLVQAALVIYQSKNEILASF